MLEHVVKYRFTSLSLILILIIFSSRVEIAQGNPNYPGILDPVLTATTGTETRIPNTLQSDGNRELLVAGSVTERRAIGATSLLGAVIEHTVSPNRHMEDRLDDLEDAAADGNLNAMRTAAQSLKDILLGNTTGEIYDGFAMLNYNRGAFAPDHMAGEYKMKMLQDNGLTAPGITGVPRRVWEVTVNMLWYDGQFDSDTFMLRVPINAHPEDMLRVHYRIYSLVREELSPTTVLTDTRLPGSVSFPFKGLDSVWHQIKTNTVTEISVDHPPLRLLRGIYTWGWRVHPPRIQFMQPIFEIVNAHTGQVELEPQGHSFAFRYRALTIDDIGAAAPEKKMYFVAQAVLDGASAEDVLAMLTDADVAPRGTAKEWANLAKDQLQLPPEARDILAAEGISKNDFGSYRMVSVFLNNEMYGDGPDGNRIEGWHQGDRFQVKLINLDNHTHYFRNVDFGNRLHDDIKRLGKAGSNSFEIMNFKPTYGAPKVAEMQWRAGWGFRPHFDVIQQQDVFPRSYDKTALKPFFDGSGQAHMGFQYSAAMRGGDFRFNPPPFIIGSMQHPSAFRLREADGSNGLVIGRTTEGYGVAKMCSHADHPMGTFCTNDVSAFNPHGVMNRDTDGDGINDALWFPPFLRNPDPEGGDIIAPTPAWKPFLWINPNNGTLFNDPADPAQGYWVDKTYAHGAPISAGQGLSATIEAPRASGQAFYQFDDLFHDDAIFSPHPTFGGDFEGGFTAEPDPSNITRNTAGPAAPVALEISPNPFNPAATILLALERDTEICVDVIDGRGRRVRQLSCGLLKAGTNQLVWKGRDDAGQAVASGIYFIKAYGEGISIVRKVSLLK